MRLFTRGEPRSFCGDGQPLEIRSIETRPQGLLSHRIRPEGPELSDTDHELERNIETTRSWIDACDRIVVLTGAGISTDSGIQDFRGPKGLWTLNPEAEKASTRSRLSLAGA